MYAVFATGGKQYRACEGEILRVEKLDAEPGATVDFDQVLMTGEGDGVKLGGGKVSAEVQGHGRHEKIRIIKHNRRKHYHKEQGHRQSYTEIKITGVSGG